MLYIIVGPTCSGKTTLACQLSDYFDNANIINIDAFQVYKDMDVGTAKISKDSKYYKRHLLLDFKYPDQTYSIKEFQEDFRRILKEHEKDKNIIAVGGSGLYLASAIYDYHFDNENVEVNTSDLEEMDNNQLYQLLLKLDPISAEGIHPNNRKRVIRAIVIARMGNLKSDQKMEVKQTPYIPKDSFKIFFINPKREELYQRINQRVDEMIEQGLIDEVKMLLNKYNLSLTSSQAIGYKEIIAFLNDELSKEDAIELIKKRSRNYAKRQVTFFKHQFECIEVDDPNKVLEMIKNER